MATKSKKREVESDAHAVDMEAVPDDTTHPRGWYQAKLVAFETGDIGGRFTINLECELRKPKDFAGMPYYSLFFLGTDKDPEFRDPKSLRGRDMVKLKKLLQHAGVKMKGGNLEDYCEQAEGEELMIQIGKRVDKDGEPRNTLARTAALGDREPEITDEDYDEAPSKKKKKVVNKAKPKDDDEEEEEEEEEPEDEEEEEDEDEDDRPKKKAKGKPAKKAKSKSDDEDDEDEEEESDDDEEDEDEGEDEDEDEDEDEEEDDEPKSKKRPSKRGK